jgi:hypothetical protein
MSIGGIAQNSQVLTPSYVPLGKPAAGLESPESKDQTLPPVEETSASEKNRHQPHLKADAVSADENQRDKEESAHEPTDDESLEHASAAPHETLAASQIDTQSALQIALQRAAALHGDHTQHSVDGAVAVDSFSAASGQTLAPGSLLDQRS